LTNQLTKHGGLLENLSISIDRWLVPVPQENGKKKHQINLPHQLSKPYIKNNSIYLIFVTIFMLVNATLFITRAFQFRKSNFLVIFARACGEILSLIF
jgi:NADPH oxidase 5